MNTQEHISGYTGWRAYYIGEGKTWPEQGIPCFVMCRVSRVWRNRTAVCVQAPWNNETGSGPPTCCCGVKKGMIQKRTGRQPPQEPASSFLCGVGCRKKRAVSFLHTGNLTSSLPACWPSSKPCCMCGSSASFECFSSPPAARINEDK